MPRNTTKKIETVEITKGENGFGFTVSDQKPLYPFCYLSYIVPGSPADRAGLRPGDFIFAVNSQNVSKATPHEVVRLAGLSKSLKLQIYHSWNERYRYHRFCYYCQKWGHTMLYCHKLKDCVLCYGKHNPLKCWRFSSIRDWMFRAEQLSRCGGCLTLFTAGERRCSNCHGRRVSWNPICECNQETQTEEDSSIVQEYQTKLQEKQSTIEDQRIQMEELNNKILSLEDKLESSITAINELNWQLENNVKEKEKELQRVNTLDLVCREKETELRKLQQQICQKDFELEQHKKTSAQPSQTIPATAQQPNPVITSNNSGDFLETSHIKATLIDIQNQQQKISMVVNHLYNKIKTRYVLAKSFKFQPIFGTM